MKSILTAVALFLLIPGNALAGTGYDRCIKEESALKAQEAGDCSGLGYLLNPSACFATQRALKQYASGRCKGISRLENGGSTVQKEKPEKSVNSMSAVDQQKSDGNVAPQERMFEQLQEENARLRAEIIRLTAENERLKKPGR